MSVIDNCVRNFEITSFQLNLQTLYLMLGVAFLFADLENFLIEDVTGNAIL